MFFENDNTQLTMYLCFVPNDNEFKQISEKNQDTIRCDISRLDDDATQNFMQRCVKLQNLEANLWKNTSIKPCLYYYRYDLRENKLGLSTNHSFAVFADKYLL